MSKILRLYYSGGKKNNYNFGDTISPLIVSYLSGRRVVYSDIESCDCVSIGSVIDKVLKKKWKRFLRLNFKPITILGTGSVGPNVITKNNDLNILSLRGPLTSNLFKNTNNLTLCDPGILISSLIKKPIKKFTWGIIPHVSEKDLPILKEMKNNNKNCIIIDPANSNPLETATLIASCNFIISSSLHGLIAADSLNIPHVWMKISNKIIGGNWKFNDYFLGMYNRQVEPLIITNNLAKSWENNIQIGERKLFETKINELMSIDLTQI
jgi:pyruvyltransferase